MIKSYILFTLITVLSISALYGQTEYQISLANSKQVGNNSFSFDVFIKSTDSDFQLTSYQCALVFNLDRVEGDSISFNYVPGSCTIIIGCKYFIIY